MSLSKATTDILNRENTQSKRLRFMLAKLYGANINIELRGFLLQATNEELESWQAIQNLFCQHKGELEELKNLAEKARIEYLTETAFEQGRKYAYSMPPADIAEHGLTWRETKNPHIKDPIALPEIKQAWTAGFQNAFEIISAESW